VLVEPGWITAREHPVRVAGWPAPLGPLRIAALSDLHTGAPHITPEKLRTIVAMVNRARPDLVVLLEDTAVRLPVSGEPLWLAGVSDPWTRPADIARALAAVPEVAPVIVVTHNPDIFPRMPARVLLTLAGHTHGGQVYLPVLGRLIVPSRYGSRYAIGHVHEDGRDLFVTPGIGTSIIPVRFRVPPEISLVTVSR
jgi:predicted MPP superfamily phosphohydrolase